MKKLMLISFVSFATIQAQAADFLQLGLFNPTQLSAAENDLTGLRLNIYGMNQNVSGLDIGIVNNTQGDFKGLGIGIVNVVRGSGKGIQCSPYGVGLVDGDFTGLQLASFYAKTEGDMVGLQFSIVTKAGSGKGVQLGLVNKTDSMKGLQLGLVNITDEMKGIQIGLANIIKANETIKFFPFVNARF